MIYKTPSDVPACILLNGCGTDACLLSMLIASADWHNCQGTHWAVSNLDEQQSEPVDAQVIGIKRRISNGHDGLESFRVIYCNLMLRSAAN